MKSEKGFILILTMVMLVLFTIIALSAVQTSIFEIKLAGRHLAKTKSFFHAESGWNEFIGKAESGEFVDNDSLNPNWKYENSSNNWSIKVIHVLTKEGNVQTFNGRPSYIVESTGFENEGCQVNEVKLVQSPSLDPPASLYAKSMVTVKGSSTIIDGSNKCLGNSKPGIITTASSIITNGNPTILPSQEIYSTLNLNVDDMISYIKDYSNFKYGPYLSNQTMTGGDWGMMTGGGNNPLNPVNDPNVVYFDMNDVNSIKLTGGSHGTGILIVNGDLEIYGGFNWYGLIIVSGSIIYSGGGEKNITGGVISGGNTSLDNITIGGNASILYCGDIEKYLRKKVRFMKVIYWRNK